MDALKVFAVGVARIAAIIVVVIVSLVVLGFGGVMLWQNWTEAQETARTASLEETTVWDSVTLKAFDDVKLTLSTKWFENELLYQFDVVGYPPAIEAAREGGTGFWTLLFNDDAGFQVDTVDVSLNDMSRRAVSRTLRINTSTFMSADHYRRIASWEIEWRGFD